MDSTKPNERFRTSQFVESRPIPTSVPNIVLMTIAADAALTVFQSPAKRACGFECDDANASKAWAKTIEDKRQALAKVDVRRPPKVSEREVDSL